MRFFNEDILVVNYGIHSLKAVLYHATPKGASILRTESMPIYMIEHEEEEYEHTSDEDGEESISEESPGDHRIRSIQHFLEIYFPDQTNIILVMPMDRIYVRDVTVPVTNPREIQATLPFEAESLLPISIDVSETLGLPVSADGDSTNLISFTAGRRDLLEFATPFNTEKMSLRMITPEASALAGVVGLLDMEYVSGRRIAQLDMGGKSTLLNILDDGKLVYTRRISLGGGDITREIAQLLKLSYETAEAVKLEIADELLGSDASRNLSPVSAPEIKQITKKQLSDIRSFTKDILDEITAEVRRSFVSLGGNPVEVILISGGSSRIPGYPFYLQDSMGIPVESYPLSVGNGESFAPYACAIGAFEQFEKGPKDRLDFLKTSFGRIFHTGGFKLRTVAAPTIVFSLAMVFILASFVVGILRDQNTISEYNKKIAIVAKSIPGIESKGDPVSQAVKICNTRLQSHNFSSEGEKVLEIMEQLTDMTPGADVFPMSFSRIRYSGTEVELHMEMDSLADVAKLQKAYEKNEDFTNLSIQSDQKTNGKVTVRIKMTPVNKSGSEKGRCR